MPSHAEFYQRHLDRVSRSFAFCIRQLPEPLRSWVGLSYLLCRVVDTIEDSAWPVFEEQFAAFRLFDESLGRPDAAKDLKNWMSRFPEDIPLGEKALLADAAQLMEDLHQLPPQVRDVIRELVLSMSQGMQHFCRQRRNGCLRLSTLGEVNQYCFFVAGVVGELLVKLISRVEPRVCISQLNVLRAHHFGLFLQKVNLLKDQVGDEKVGRHLIPSREMVEDSSQTNAVQALDFLIEIPTEQIEFRRFCAWSLFLGLEALSVARDSIARERVLKVPRGEMQALLEKVEGALHDEKELRSLFDNFRDRLGWNKPVPKSGASVEFPEWLLKLYRGPLGRASLMELGLN